MRLDPRPQLVTRIDSSEGTLRIVGCHPDRVTLSPPNQRLWGELMHKNYGAIVELIGPFKRVEVLNAHRDESYRILFEDSGAFVADSEL